MPRRRAGLLLVIAAFVAVLFLFSVLSGLLTDWWWFKEIGYQVVFTRELVTRVLLFLAAGGLTFGVRHRQRGSGRVRVLHNATFDRRARPRPRSDR